MPQSLLVWELIKKYKVYGSLWYAGINRAFYQEAEEQEETDKNPTCKLLFTEEPDGIPADLHDKNLNISRLKGFPNTTDRNKRDFRTQLYLLTNEIYSVTDTKECELLINKFKVIKGVEEIQHEREVIIYRLFQLGIVKDWIVKDFFKKTYLVKYEKIDLVEVSKNIFKKISSYSPSDEEVSEHKKNLDLIIKENNEPMKALIAYLLKWNYEHFVYNRRQSLKNLYENIGIVNEQFCQRLMHLQREDSNVNAVLILNNFAQFVPLSVDDDMLDEMKEHFRAFLDED